MYKAFYKVGTAQRTVSWARRRPSQHTAICGCV